MPKSIKVKTTANIFFGWLRFKIGKTPIIPTLFRRNHLFKIRDIFWWMWYSIAISCQNQSRWRRQLIYILADYERKVYLSGVNWKWQSKSRKTKWLNIKTTIWSWIQVLFWLRLYNQCNEIGNTKSCPETLIKECILQTQFQIASCQTVWMIYAFPLLLIILQMAFIFGLGLFFLQVCHSYMPSFGEKD